MAHGYHTIQHWNKWLSHQFLGGCLLQAEHHLLKNLLKNYYGKHALLIGVPHQYELLSSSVVLYHSLVSPLIEKDEKSNHVEGDFYELPFHSGSIDLVMLPHTLELVDNPRQLIAEACRIIKPEGLIVVCGFNPYSMWGLKKLFTKNKYIPWSRSFIPPHTVKKWLHLADFEMEKQKTALFRPPITHLAFYKKLHFLEQLGSKCFPSLGAAYVLLARAKVVPLTPIRLKWKQQLSSIRISTTMSGHIARRS